MKKNWHRVIAALLGVMMCVTMLTPAVIAEDTVAKEEYPEVAIPVTIELTGDRPRTEDTFEVVLKAKNGAPMPEGSVNGTYTMEIEGEDKVDFPKITYTRVGIYEYTIYQLEGGNKYVTYDETVYEVTVFVTNKEGGGLEVTVVVYEQGEEDKCEIVFENRYDYPHIPIIPPPETKPEETKPVETQPGKETEPPETKPAETDPPETEPEPEETEPEETEPEETEPETEPEPETEIVTETEPEPVETLVQTGQLNWPISVLSVGGMGFVAVGCVFLSGDKNKKDKET